MNSFKTSICWAMLFLGAALAQAQSVTVTNAWARVSVKGQNATGVFMSLKSPVHTKLVGVSTSVAKVSEVHQMSMENNVMKMAPLPNGLELNAGSVVELKPGGYHIMLMDLQKVLEKDSKIDLSLTFQDDSGKKSRVELNVPVLLQSPMEEGSHSMPHQDHQHH